MMRRANSLGVCYNGEGVAGISRAPVSGTKGGEQNNLGFCYKGSAKDLKRAVDGTKAAEQNHANAQYFGRLLQEGRGRGEGLARAVEWFMKAAEQICDAQNNWAFAENGVKSSRAPWYERRPSRCASAQLWACYKNGQGGEEPRARRRVVRRRPSKRRTGSLGEYYNGDGEGSRARRRVVPKAARMCAAQYNLGVCYYKGEGVAKDLERAVELWKKAAKQSHQAPNSSRKRASRGEAPSLPPLFRLQQRRRRRQRQQRRRRRR